MKQPFIVTEADFKSAVAHEDETGEAAADTIGAAVILYFASRRKMSPLLGMAEVAELLGVAKPNAAALRKEGRLPEPLVVLASGPIWLSRDIEPIARELKAARRKRAARR